MILQLKLYQNWLKRKTGRLTTELLNDKDEEGITVREALDNFGFCQGSMEDAEKNNLVNSFTKYIRVAE